MSYKQYGNDGEKEVASLVPCPNCGKELMTLPESYPMVDLQCSACNFRVQVKSSSTNPYKSTKVYGAGWDILEKVLKAGYLVPPVMVNYKWPKENPQQHEIRFYPFLMVKNLKPRVAYINHGKRVYNMFDYDFKELPYFTLYKNLINPLT